MLNPSEKHTYRNADILLLLLYAALAAVILFRVNVEGTGYLSPDSKAYLGLAQNLKDGHGLYMQQADGARRYFSTWPVGYPVLIYLFSEISSLDVYWSSKVLNLIFLGCGFLMLRRISRAYSFILASIYGAYTYMEVYSFTWSEAPFLLGILLLSYISQQLWLGKNTQRNTLLMFLLCLSLFLLRYIGAFSFGVPALLGLYFWVKRKYKLSLSLLSTAGILTACAGLYLYTNYRLSGFATGFDRLEAETEATSSFVAMLLRGLMNEFWLIREYRPQNQPDYLFYATASLQLVVLAYLISVAEKHARVWAELKSNSFSVACLAVAVLYFVAILGLRIVSRFDDLDYRLLSPLSFPAVVGLAYAFISLPDSDKAVVRAKYTLFGFMLLSLLLNVPKKFIVSQLQLLF